MNANAHDDPETLERRSDSIRADVGETLDALQRNYSPGALIDRSMDLIRDHGGEVATNLMHTVRRNPLPVLLIAAGAAWMVAAQFRSSREDHPHGAGEQREGRNGDSAFKMDSSLDAEEPSGNGSDTLGTATQAATGGAHKLSERVRNVATSARRESRHAAEGMTRLLQEQPFAVGAAGIAIGALIGTMLPETAQEDRLLGSARDEAMRKARSVGKRGFETARQKVHEAVDRTTETLRGGRAADEQTRESEAMSNGTAAL
jgi:ElaB/YqjD/DUF883 family membrane-anchored ribosome-binding protein